MSVPRLLIIDDGHGIILSGLSFNCKLLQVSELFSDQLFQLYDNFNRNQLSHHLDLLRITRHVCTIGALSKQREQKAGQENRRGD